MCVYDILSTRSLKNFTVFPEVKFTGLGLLLKKNKTIKLTDDKRVSTVISREAPKNALSSNNEVSFSAFRHLMTGDRNIVILDLREVIFLKIHYFRVIHILYRPYNANIPVHATSL